MNDRSSCETPPRSVLREPWWRRQLLLGAASGFGVALAVVLLVGALPFPSGLWRDGLLATVLMLTLSLFAAWYFRAIFAEVDRARRERDEAEATLRQRQREALNHSEEKYRSLFESSRDAIYIATVGGRLLDVNPAAVALFGYGSKEEMLSLDIARDLYVDPTERERAESVFDNQGYVDDLELELKTRDGRRIRVLETASATFDERGELSGYRGILRDVTEQRKLEARWRQSQKMEAVGRLAGGIAHDFNNLLTAINGYTDLLLARLEPSSPLREIAEEVRQAGRRAADLTRRLLHISRQRPAALGPIDLNRIVTDMEKLLRRVIGEDIQLITRLEPGVRPILADGGQIEQVILNLAVNARDAMPEGGQLTLETASFTVPGGLEAARPAAIAPGVYVLFSVGDTGMGIPRNVREHLFEPFFTTKEGGDNTGLGLAMVYSFVERCGGAIEVDSAVGTGTTFYLYLPVAEGPLRVRPVSRPERLELPRGEETVLLVEDEDSVRALVRDILERQGYQVLSAACAEEALDVYGRCPQPPDMLLTDVVMPDRSGPALASELAERNPTLKVLFMSGYADGVKGFERLPRVDACFLQKPFSPESLALKVRQILDAA